MDEHTDARITRSSGLNTWRAGCGGSRTSGSEGGPQKPTRRKPDRALRPDPYTELRNRGIQDTFIVCCDGLKGLPDAIRATWVLAEVQLCVVHLVRSSLRYTARKHWGRICRELREIYTAPTVDAAEARFAEFAETWRERYPAMINTWEQSWGEFVPFLDYPVELRTVVYTTNAIESLNARFRRAVRHRGHFPNEQAALKVLYLVATERRKNRANPAGRINAWKPILNALTIHYGDRIQAAN